MTYWQTYRPWLIRLLNERIYLSQRGFCPELLEIAVRLRRLIEYNGYRNDGKLAALITRKYSEIIILIPNNNAHAKQIEKLNEAVQVASKNYQYS